ncbi:uncharacterized protein G2W53_029306 [Senna tora]|uniref:Uncharacterized protein n=1 Tax=Senna tora TaxID=362788 RepID=A0A834T4Z7_9FABA|nr:uncharacterized protein G2W53_029306 [Senna tora]
MAMAIGVEMAKKLSCEVVIVECDAKKIVEMENENFQNVSVLGESLMSPKKTIENKKTSHKKDQPKMIKKEEEDDLRLPNKEDDNKQEDIVSKDLNNARSSAHIDSEDSSEKSPELFCIADYEIPGDIPDFQTLATGEERVAYCVLRYKSGLAME